jgi:hypothetical protein
VIEMSEQPIDGGKRVVVNDTEQVTTITTAVTPLDTHRVLIVFGEQPKAT